MAAIASQQDFPHPKLLLAAVACGVVSAAIVAWHSLLKPGGAWFLFAAALLLIVFHPHLPTFCRFDFYSTLSLSISTSPCTKGVCHGVDSNLSDSSCHDLCNDPCSPQHFESSKEAREWKSTWALLPCASCCALRTERTTQDFQTQRPGPVLTSPQRSITVDPQTARNVLKLRAQLSDLLGQPTSVRPSTRAQKADDVALTTVERYGGERSCLARFLRARKFNIGEAEKMFRNTVEFRRSNHLIPDCKSREAWDNIRPLFAAAPVTFTDEGNIVIYFRMAEFLRLWRRGVNEEQVRVFYISWMERMLQLQAEGRARVGHGLESEMPACIEVYDLQGIGISHLKCLPGLGMMMRILRIGQDNYPENLHTAVMLNVPVIAFKPMQMVQSVLDVRTRAKMRFARDNGHQLLRELLRMDPVLLTRLFQNAVTSGYVNGLA